MKQHPWCNGRLESIDSLTDSERILTFISGHTAKGDLDSLGRDWCYLPQSDHSAGVESILQTHLFAGYPRTINAIARVRRINLADEVSSEYREGSSFRMEDSWKNGVTLCSKIYGKNYTKLREHMQGLHPDLDRWMLEIGYGRVLSRPGLSLRLRELCILSVLSGQNVSPQLFSHLWGALHAGASLAECESVLAQTKLIWGEEAQEEVSMVWQKFLDAHARSCLVS